MQPLSQPAPEPPLAAVARHLGEAATVDAIMEITRSAARRLTDADGATFVLREEDKVYYADEDAIGPLWKGRRFAATACISGWVMMYRNPVVIENVFEDPRIPVDVYRATFVRSLAMVPIRPEAPIAAIGIYWARPHRASAQEVLILQALASSVGDALTRIRYVPAA